MRGAADWTRAPHRTPTTTVVLHGALARQFGRRHELGVRTAAEAAHALCRLHPGFQAAFQPEYFQVVRGSVARGLTLSPELLHLQVGTEREIHFVPKAAGAKNSGVGKAILGAVIVVAAVAAAIPSGGGSIALGATAFSVGGYAVSYGAIAVFGAGLLLSGISQIISPQGANNSQQTDPKASFGLSGAMNSTEEGTVIPVIYGRQRVGSVVASFGYSAEDYDPNALAAGSYTLPDGSTAPPGSLIAALGGTTASSSGAVGSGGGGKGGGGSGGAKESPNTLRSNAVVRIIDVLGEGPVGGLVNGAQSIFFNNTPLMASDGSYNFQGVTWETRLGYPDQAAIAGYPAAEQTLSSELGLPYNVLQLSPKTITVESATATAVRLTISIPALLTQNTSTGDLLAGPDLDFHFEIQEVSPVAGPWTRVVTEHITGQKCVSTYQRSYRVDLPGASDATRATVWNIRMTRTSPDDVLSNTKSQSYFDEVTLITDHALTYGNTAYVALTIDASAFGSDVPTRTYEIDGLVCQVPLNYDAVDHAYSTTGPGTSMGTWDGASWQPAVTSNPAWCLYDLLSNGRYGLGLPPSVLAGTRFDLFPISQYCDGRVPSGVKDTGGADVLELRYALNVCMNTTEDAFRVIQSMVSTFRGMAYWGAGRVVCTADMPTEPSTLLTQANVIDGTFNYEGTSLKTRHTVARIAWQDPGNQYQTAIEVVEDFNAVVSLGQVPTDIAAFGCTSRGLAHRLGKWLLDTEKTQTETVNCATGLEHLRVRPGDVALVHDPAFVGQVLGGRCGAGSSTTFVNLDRVLDTTSQLNYALTVTLPDGTVQTWPVQGFDLASVNNHGNTVVGVAQPFGQAPAPDAAWLLTTTGTPGPHGPDSLYAVSPRQFRIAAVTEPSRGLFNIIGVFHDPNKFARVEYGIQFDVTPYSALGSLLATPLPPPANVFARDYIAGVGTTTLVRVTVSCNPASDPRVVSQQFRAEGPSETYGSASGASFDFDGLQLGTYTFSARSVGRDGRTSIWADAPAILVDGLADPPAAISNLVAQGTAMAVDISFNGTTARDLLQYELWRAPNPDNGNHPNAFAAWVPPATPAAAGATLVASFQGTTYHDSGDALGPDKSWAYWVRPVNTTQVAGAFAGPAKALTTVYLTDNLDEAIRNTAKYAQELLGGAPTIAADLNTPGTHEGQLLFNSTDGHLYSWSVATNSWVRFIAVIPDSTGKLSQAQIGTLNDVVISGTLTADQNAALLAGIADGEISGDKIASLVGSKVTGTLSNAQVLAGQIYDVDPVTGATVLGIDTTKLLGNIQGASVVGLLPHAIIDGTTVTPNSLSSPQIQANQIGARELAIGNSANLLVNSCFALSTEGWSLGLPAGSTGTLSSCATVLTSYATPDGTGVLVGAVAAGGYVDVYYKTVACLPGETLEAQAMLLPQGASASLYVDFSDPMGTHVAFSAFSAPVGSQPAVAAGAQGSLAPFRQATLIAAVPAGASAARFLIRVTSPAAGAVTAFITRTGFGRTVAGATQVSAWAAGGVTSIGGGMIATQSIVTRNLASGAVTAETLAVASASNVVGNPTCPSTSWGWLLGGNAPNAALGSVTGDAMAPSSFALAGEGSGALAAASLSTTQSMQARWDPDSAGGVPCAAGDWWEAQAYLGVQRCWGQCRLEFFNGAGASLGVTSGARVAASPGGSELSAYGFSWTKAQAPAGATRVSLLLSAQNDNAADIGGPAGSSPFMFFTRCVLGRSTPVPLAASTPQPYQIGGVTQVSGGQIKTGAVTARVVAAGQIQAQHLAVGSADNLIWNGCCGQSGSGWMSAPPVQAWQVGSAFALAGFGTGYVHQPLASGATLDVSWAPNNGSDGTVFAYDGVNAMPWGASTPCTPGALMEAQVLVNTHRCSCELFLLFLGLSNGAMTLLGAPSTGPRSFNAQSVARDRASYNQLSVRGTVPAGATYCTLMMRMGSTAASQAVFGSASGTDAYLMFTQAGLAACLPNVPAPMPWAQGGATVVDGGMVKTASIQTLQLAAGSVKAGTIDAGAVTTGALAAGAVTAAKIAVGNPSNVVWNSCPDQTCAGWARATFGTNMPAYGDPTILMDSASKLGNAATWGLANAGSAFSQYVGPAGNKIYDSQGFVWDWPLAGGPGKTYGAAAAMICGNGMAGSVQLLFLTTAGAQIGAALSSATLSGNNTNAGGVTIDLYSRLTLLGVAPAGTATVVLRIKGTGTPAGASQPFMAWTQAMCGEVAAGTTAVGPWVNGGVTTIDGGMIKTQTLDAAAINTGTLLAGSAFILALTATTVSAQNIKAVLIGTNRLDASEINADTLTVGAVKAGAIGSDQIAANQIHASHLAADFALLSSAQIGYLTVDTANIKNLAVGNGQIANGAVTSASWGYNGGGGVAYVTVVVTQGSNGVLLMVRADFPGIDPNSGGNACSFDLARSADGQHWTDIHDLSFATQGSASDFVVDQPGVGAWNYRISGANTGTGPSPTGTSIVAIAINK